MSRYAHEHPDGPPMGQSFGSALDRADDARKEAKIWGDGDPGDEHVDRAECPSCGRVTRMMHAFGECPYADCRHGRDAS